MIILIMHNTIQTCLPRDDSKEGLWNGPRPRPRPPIQKSGPPAPPNAVYNGCIVQCLCSSL